MNPKYISGGAQTFRCIMVMKALYLERAERAKRSTRGVNCARIGKEHIIALKSKGVCDCDESGKSRESEKEL